MIAGSDIMDVGRGNEPAYALLAQIHRRAFEPQGDAVWNAAAFRQLIESPGMRAHIFHQSDQPIGFCLYRTVLDEAELVSIAVDPVFQGSGLSHQIMTHMIEALKSQQVQRLFLEVRKDNKAAIKLYEKSGFNIVGERANYYKSKDGKKTDAIIFSLDLPNTVAV